jgi:hypothetical protein
MKLTSFSFACMLLGVILGTLLAQSCSVAHAAEKAPRMELLGRESLDTGSGYAHILYMHDNETKQEVVCVEYSSTAPSCYLTGRKW